MIVIIISVLSSGGIKMVNAAYHSWEFLIYHLFGTDLLQYISTYFRPSVSKSCPSRAATMWRGLRRYPGRSTPFKISGCVIALVDGAQCKCKRTGEDV